MTREFPTCAVDLEKEKMPNRMRSSRSPGGYGKCSVAALVLAVLCRTCAPQPLSTPAAWTTDQYPDPVRQAAVCRSTRSFRLCDPDAILSATAVQNVEDWLTVERRVPSPCPEDPSATTAAATSSAPDGALAKPTIVVEYAVALTRKMDLTLFGSRHEAQDLAAEHFARQVHDTWGVGQPTTCGGTGVLLFLSNEDRALYISRGAALEAALTDRRLDQVLEHMKPLLQRQKYDEALVMALAEMDFYLHSGPPKFWEMFNQYVVDYMGMMWIGAMFAWVIRSIRKNQEQRRAYAQVASQLSELDRARAEALQGQYRAVSCPICLENFVPVEEGSEEKKGSDGLPLKLLRCGHVFDETCWAEWVQQGRGQVDKCPICQQDVGGRPSSEANRSSSAEPGTIIHRPTSHHRHHHHDSSSTNSHPDRAEGSTGIREAIDEDHLLRQQELRIRRLYERERAFRLARLMTRYPQYVRPQQVQRWTASTYDGSLAHDPTFVNSDPSRVTSGSSSSSSSGSQGLGARPFGGGFSGGGRGGRW